MLRATLCTTLLFFAGCAVSDGDRCNPLQYSNNGVQGNCKSGFACVYPTTYPSANTCGVAYCCSVDDSGKITDTRASCQPDESLASVCMLDFSVPDASDAGETD